ncbi:HAMP domain-containing sensor histidine kinase [Paenibacillus sp. JX-17]|uniref:Heme sensor protein HssS n=1 Tax=Paenibacillus lacisoli TaxID=3064525 RepID=A0ABT9CG25_9BACL|nr:HAMP domain-containing sensor histidine kinase [Paenibacillus sp. JX-17]MDO7908226.1 HAMP domain-containing sensor histidine kinase [Paenibacillus sp. JX-17]
MKTLYSRVFLFTLLVIIVSSMLGFLSSNIYYHLKLKPYNDNKLMHTAVEIERYIEDSAENMDRYLDHAAALGYQIYLTDGQGDEQYYGRSFREKNLSRLARDRVLKGERYHGIAEFPNKPFITGFFENTLSNTVGTPIQYKGHTYALFIRPDVIQQFGELRVFFALIILCTVVISILLFLVSTRYLVKPISRLSEATKRIAQGDYRLKLPIRRRDEIGQLAGHFTTMSQALERADQSRQQFVSNVSHEIQSPLTSIQGFAKVLAENELSKGESRQYAEIIEKESRHLAQLSKQLLLLSSLEQGEETLTMKTFGLRVQLLQVIQVLQWQLEEKGLLLKLSIPESIHIRGDEVLLMQVWMNILSNAIRYIPQGRSISIHAKPSRSAMTVSIQDTGDGIPEEHLPFVFDRFYRVDHARERSAGGTGLGLAIVQKIIQLHSGIITVSSSPEGTCFTIRLPE